MLKKLSIAALAFAASAPAFANPPHQAPAYGWRGHPHQVVRYYPHYYYAPQVIYRPVPVIPRPAPTFSIRFDLPL